MRWLGEISPSQPSQQFERTAIQQGVGEPVLCSGSPTPCAFSLFADSQK